ncbi:unnamed protein product [Mycena citricolor]|uniref:Uncharacterized protein n=1 Tax=Mycena citricolor TaxID=2018698 RepID=A0AAD2JZI1_9AGAR|nr:unnamed protein product [Mycena citricolor]
MSVFSSNSSMWRRAMGSRHIQSFADDGDHNNEGYRALPRRSARLAQLTTERANRNRSQDINVGTVRCDAPLDVQESDGEDDSTSEDHDSTSEDDGPGTLATSDDPVKPVPSTGPTVISSPPHTTRKQLRHLIRQQKFHERREQERREYKARRSIMHRAKGARGYAGNRISGKEPKEGMVEISMDNRVAVSVFDSHGRKTVHRAHKCKRPDVLNACNEAARLVEVHGMRPTFDTSQERGKFKTYYFSLHRGSTELPRFSKDIMHNCELYNKLVSVLDPVMKYVAGIFKAEFPALYERYANAMDTVNSKHPELHACFFPFASFCINMSKTGVVTVKHIDMQNLAPGLCVVIPFGDFDPAIDCKLHVVELGYTFQLAAGTPIFFPSALYTHYNSELISKGMRGSIVAWTGASVFQYVDLGCRAVQNLSAYEVTEYKAGLKDRVRRGFRLFPKMKPVVNKTVELQ